MTRTRADWYDKANAFSAAWAERFGITPSPATTALALSVAEHETRCGDAWPGDHNWGACTKGGLSLGQRAALAAAGVHPALSPTAARETSEHAATAALVAAGLPPAADQAIHVDSAPRTGAYFTFFGKFPDDVAGAGYFIHVLAEQRSSCRSILQGADRYIDGGTGQLAEAMYRSGYYTGFHDPHVEGGAAANVADYARALAALHPGIRSALAGWTPGAEPPAVTEPATPDLGTVLGQQQALNAWARGVPGLAPLAEDGIAGPKTRARVIAFQVSHGLTGDGVVGSRTLAALRTALG